ncbi:2-aminoadipate aminotransferase [Snodgrassella alvi]|jgi:2-aminoadipate transaminase|uniref:Putative 8-amino-7-oxononanoate synthase n=1 Tax=Snodgrassella alvi TaxID=1196083 RepID=A0A2N9Y184_9NEIS|nr:PLP-dependent aminotransferase family protein [Snodgrassella alvi]PIT53147.1 2-aminoadipate aminotransferase [Snodgrassella alvi]PIT59623.1 2-aminoadipate aminotransferase [Snodgrassella alvi]
MHWKYSRRVQISKSSTIREILKVTEQADMISFAGGLPAPDAFPLAEIQTAINTVLESNDIYGALQYGPTEGYAPLRQWIANYLSNRDQISISADEILIVTGSQQALDLIGKALIDVNDKVLVETPTYLGALQSFNQYCPEYVAIASDNEGLIPESINDEVASSAKFLYCIPNFQNPTGRRLPVQRRQTLAAKAKQNGLVLIEDDPYGDLDYQGQRLPGLYTLVPENTVYLGSFSKILTPGLRLGYVLANKQFIGKLVQLKQASDLHTPSLTQYIAYQILSKNNFLSYHIPKIRQLYSTRCQYMLQSLAQFMPKEVSWNQPEGGMFIWVELPENINATELLSEAINHKVVFVPGETFFAYTEKNNCLRLAFVTVPEEKINKGIKILADIIKHRMHLQQEKL